ncbi:MAG: peptidylprolyl isomerase [Rhodospirillales bacterium]
MNIKLIITILLLLTAINLPAHAQKNMGIAAVVNDDIISVIDLEARMNTVLFTSSRNPPPEEKQRLYPQILRALIDDKLKLQEAKKRNIKVSQREIDEALNRLERSNGISKGELKNVLKRQGIPLSSLTEQIRSEIAWNRLANRVLGPRIRVSESEVNERLISYQQNKKKPEHRLSEIFLPIDSPDQENKILKLANRLHSQLKKGVSFSSLARNFSRGASSSRGGLIGWVRQGRLDNKLQTSINATPEGQFTTPIRTEIGVFILFVHKRRLPANKAQDTTHSQTQVTLQQLFFPLSSKATLVEKASQLNLAKTMASTVFNCQDMEKAGKELGSSLSGKLGTMTMSKLPQNIQNAITGLPVNKASAPIKTSGGIIVLMVCKRVKPKLPPKPKRSDRQKVHHSILNERLHAAARRFLRDLRNAAFIDIRL